MPTVPFRFLDVIVILVYLLGMAAMGVYFSKRNKTTEDYFLGNRSFPGWAVGLSMVGTSISSVTFLALPAAAYILDWRQVVPNLMLPLVAVVAISVFIPFFRRANLTSAFEYLEDRFGPMARLYGAVSFIILQVIRLGTILYLVSIPIGLLTGFPIFWIIVVGGMFIAFYTVAGGIEAVIWTDVVQTLVLIFGGAICCLLIFIKLPGGLGEILQVGYAESKFSLGPMNWNLSERTFPTMIILGIFWWLTEYSSNQNVIQRYAASISTREARKATALCALMSVPTWSFFFFLGTCIFVFYRVFPDEAVSALEADQIFPYFMLTQIPAGIAGLVIAGALAAAMSSLDSSINAVATVTVVDIVKRYWAVGREDAYYLKWARWLSALAAALMISGALVFWKIPKESMVDLNTIVTAIFGGCVCSLFLVGFFTIRVDYRSSLIALVLAIGFNIYLMLNSMNLLPECLAWKVHSYWIGILVNLFFVIVAMVIGRIRNKPHTNLKGLTVWTLEKSQNIGRTESVKETR